MAEAQTILYIEDNLDNQRLVQRVLEAWGYQVIIAPDGVSGVSCVQSTPTDLILVDINIPGLNGFETTTRLRGLQHGKHTPIVAITADNRPDTREQALAAGCDGYIAKPIDTRMLPAQINEFITGKRELLPEHLETARLREYTQRLVQRLETQMQELKAANDELTEANRLKGQLIATFSHELRTPLTSMLGYLELFERGTLGPLTELQREGLAVIARNANVLTDHLNNVLLLQEVRSTPLYRAPFALHEVLERVAQEFQHRADPQGIELRLRSQPIPPFSGDVLMIERALRNLIDNAVKFTPEGGSVVVTLHNDTARVAIHVHDSGTGISREAQDKIFKPFYQVERSMERVTSGVGIGLTIVKHVAEIHGGQVLLHSVPGHGSMFSLVLPRIG